MGSVNTDLVSVVKKGDQYLSSPKNGTRRDIPGHEQQNANTLPPVD